MVLGVIDGGVPCQPDWRGKFKCVSVCEGKESVSGTG